jgi:hypothetical protein
MRGHGLVHVAGMCMWRDVAHAWFEKHFCLIFELYRALCESFLLLSGILGQWECKIFCVDVCVS